MKKSRYKNLSFLVLLLLINGSIAYGQDIRLFKIFQFPANMIPSIDGRTEDWDIVGDDYTIGVDQLIDNRDSGSHKTYNKKDLDVKVKVGWVKGINRLYFLYEAYDNYWDFALPDLHNDIFELVVDGDRSGGPFITSFHHMEGVNEMENYFSFQGVHAQNYHIFTPAEGKDWAFVWGSQSWLRELPYANAAYKYSFSPGDSGKLTLEFWITPFDYASQKGPAYSVESILEENRIIGLSWAIIDYDDVNLKGNHNHNGFWTLSKERKMYGDASFLLPFKLMPLEQRFQKSLEAQWSFSVIDKEQRVVTFSDQSKGDITGWKWDFGDGQTSAEPNPVHIYAKPGMYVVILWIEGPAGKSRMSKIWEVALE